MTGRTNYFPDREHGEWFGYLQRNRWLSSPLEDSLWEGTLYLPRMQLVETLQEQVG